MMNTTFVPCLPETAPFSPEQRAYLNGFFAGIFSRTGLTASAPAGAAAVPQQRLTILFGSQTGTAEGLAKKFGKEAAARGLAASIRDMGSYTERELNKEDILVIITSTFGDGDPPDNAKTFWESINNDGAPRLTGLQFAVLALGDSSYPKFCEFGKNCDQRLEQLGARRLHARLDCDVDYEQPFRAWADSVLVKLAEAGKLLSAPVLDSEAIAMTAPAIGRVEVPDNQTAAGFEKVQAAPAPDRTYSRNSPFLARLCVNRKLSGPGSEKETRHFELSLDGSGITYQAGDALGVLPTNCPDSVQNILAAQGWSGEELVKRPTGEPSSLREVLLRDYEITRIPQPLLSAFAEQTRDPLLCRITGPDANGESNRFLLGREIVDLFLAFPQVKFQPAAFIGFLKKLQPRLYSIASSPTAHSGQVHLTVGVVRYESLGWLRKGVCSCFLAERAPAGTLVPVFLHRNTKFRLPAPDCPIIMIGPGTGIAPFRGFLYERQAIGASGKNWLFFGEQRVKTDFLYRDELETLCEAGTLTRLDTAFSRDQPEKIYVQQRMRERARDLFDWLEQGASIYVCGDASRMAKDVDAALHRVIETGGQRTREQALEYVVKLKAEKRYQRDVY